MLERKRQDNLLFFRNLWYTLSYPNRKGTFFLRTIGRLLLSAIFLVLTVLLVLAAKYAPALVFSFYPEFSRKLLSVISSVTKAIPLMVGSFLQFQNRRQSHIIIFRNNTCSISHTKFFIRQI